MDLYLTSVIVFLIILAMLIYRDRKNFKRESILLFRKTKKGKNFLIKLGTRFPRFWKLIGSAAIIVGFIISIWFFYMLLFQTHLLLTKQIKPRGFGVILPSPTAQAILGSGFIAVPFWFFIIAIALLFVVHEGFHGIMAARENLKIKNLGWLCILFFPLLQGAFVELDEKQLRKRKIWTQLRVLASGSFANFLLAALALILSSFLIFSCFYPIGALVYGYPTANVNAFNISRLNNKTITSIQELKTSLLDVDNETLIEIGVGNKTYISTKTIMLYQLSKGENFILFEDYPAARANLTGRIIKINEYDVKLSSDINYALSAIGPNKDIEIITTDGIDNKTFNLKTIGSIDTDFKLDLNIYILVSMEHVIPGIIDFSGFISKSWNSIFGSNAQNTWKSISLEIKIWEWIKNNYPVLSSRAQDKLKYLNSKLKNYKEPGFIGINSNTEFKLKSEFLPIAGLINFLTGLLFWLFLINFGVGALNLLPIKGLDGGRMWELVFKKISKKYAETIINTTSMIIIFIILLNFLIAFNLI